MFHRFLPFVREDDFVVLGRVDFDVVRLWPMWIFHVVDMVFGFDRYRLAVADIVVVDMVAPH